MDPNRNDNGIDSDFDEFSDFGGFEAADPVDPNVIPAQAVGGIQAGPNPWVANLFPTAPGGRNVQPDLLCGQNRFPQHLDNPLTVDVAGSAEASLPVDNGPQRARNNSTSGFEPDLDFDIGNGSEQVNLDHINLANDILDGSFRSASSSHGTQSGAGYHGQEQLPDISGFERTLGIPNNTVARGDSMNSAESSNNVDDVMGAVGGVPDNQSVSSPSNQTGSSDRPRIDQIRNTRQQETSQGEESVVEVPAPSGEPELRESPGELVSDPNMPLVAQRKSEERENLQKELEQQLQENVRLREDLERAQALAEEAKHSLDQLKADHTRQLEDLRSAGHESLTVVVSEYQQTLATCAAEQRLASEQSLVQKLQQETEKFRELLHLQKEEFDRLQIEERRRNEEKLLEAVEQMRKTEQERFEKHLTEERLKTEENIKVEIQKQKDAAAKEIEKVVAEERRKAQEMLDKERETFQSQLRTVVEGHQQQVQECLQEQRDKHQEEVGVLLEEERRRGRESVQQCTLAVRSDMATYLEQQRQVDRAVQQRQLASLDLFLESARHQLSLIMNNNTSGETAQDRGDNSTPQNEADGS